MNVVLSYRKYCIVTGVHKSIIAVNVPPLGYI